MENRQLGGIGFLIANAAMFANGLIAHTFANTPQSRKAGLGRMGSSALWAGNAMILAKYGDEPVAHQQQRLEEKLAAYLHAHGVPLDVAEIKKADAHTQRGYFRKLEDFLYSYPIEAGNAYYATASLGYGVSGHLRRQDGNTQAGNANIGVTALSMTGALASILIPERTPEQVKQQGQEGTLWGSIQKHPLGYVRWIFLGVDALAGMEALGEYKSARNMARNDPYRKWQFTMAGLSVLAMGTAMVSDWLTSGSKKAGGSPEARSAAQQALETHAAAQLASLPAGEQATMAKVVAQYLVAQPELRFVDRDADQLARELLQKLHTLGNAQPAPAHLHTERLAGAGPSVSPVR